MADGGLVGGGADDGPEVHDPAEKDDPEQPGQDEVAEGGEDASLEELSESGDEEAAEGGDDVAGGALSVHDFVKGVELMRSARISRSSLFCGRMKGSHWLGCVRA